MLPSKARLRCLLFALVSLSLVAGCAESPDPLVGTQESGPLATPDAGDPAAGLTDDQRAAIEAAQKLADELAKGAGSKANDELLDALLEKTSKSQDDDQN